MKTPFSSLLRTRTSIFGPRQRPGPVLCLVAIFVVACAAALLLAAGSPAPAGPGLEDSSRRPGGVR